MIPHNRVVQGARGLGRSGSGGARSKDAESRLERMAFTAGDRSS
jgi:hypothetical protein